jgi:hypothetical protein
LRLLGDDDVQLDAPLREKLTHHPDTGLPPLPLVNAIAWARANDHAPFKPHRSAAAFADSRTPTLVELLE